MADEFELDETVELEEIVLVDEDGEEHAFVMLDAIEVDGNQYAILQPVLDEIDEENEDEEPEAIILKFESDGSGEEILVDIEDDEEWEKVADAWQEIVEEERDDG
ncbi:MAG: DUF1292 domain-containing protein [Clostridiales bacterium]|nr:DUF1292 domain-containing protein [Clostridiales bacterium]